MSARISAIVLAAGSSRRMGADNKLLLTFNDKTMVSHVIDQLLSSAIDDIIVVTGNDADKVKASITQNVRFIDNPDYDQGLSTSVKAGIDALANHCDGVMICLGDMPYIMAKDYNKLLSAFQKGKIITPTTQGKIGNPLIFSQKYFADFNSLNGDKGARNLLKKYPDDVIEVDLDNEAIFNDIDTPEDYQNHR